MGKAGSASAEWALDTGFKQGLGLYVKLYDLLYFRFEMDFIA